MKATIPYIIMGIFGMAAGMAVSCCPDKKTAEEIIISHDVELIQALQDYQSRTECLLDSIYHSDSSFLDTWGETDTYQEYLISKQKTDSILNLEDCPY